MQIIIPKKNNPKMKQLFLILVIILDDIFFYLTKAGYESYFFEISRINSKILEKIFCLNKNIKIVTIITKGKLLVKVMKNIYYIILHIIQVILIYYAGNTNIPINRENNINEVVEFMQLNNYYNFLSKKNIALIKIDIEGSEGNVIKSGI